MGLKSKKEAITQLQEMSEKLLANMVIEKYEISFDNQPMPKDGYIEAFVKGRGGEEMKIKQYRIKGIGKFVTAIEGEVEVAYHVEINSGETEELIFIYTPEEARELAESLRYSADVAEQKKTHLRSEGEAPTRKKGLEPEK